jgi:hypothetical protein
LWRMDLCHQQVYRSRVAIQASFEPEWTSVPRWNEAALQASCGSTRPKILLLHLLRETYSAHLGTTVITEPSDYIIRQIPQHQQFSSITTSPARQLHVLIYFICRHALRSHYNNTQNSRPYLTVSATLHVVQIINQSRGSNSYCTHRYLRPNIQLPGSD